MTSSKPSLFPAPLSQSAAWSKLPPAIFGSTAKLPTWARQLAPFMPKTTASLLQLDYVQRVTSPVPPRLRAAMRWISAQINGSKFGEACAEADGLLCDEAVNLPSDLLDETRSAFSEAERVALSFARQMTIDSAAVTDEQCASLVSHFGEKIAASMVLLMAYANFHDRLLICLGAALGDGERVLAAKVEFAPSVFVAGTTPPAPRAAEKASPELLLSPKASSGAASYYESLQTELEKQRQKPTRLPIPDWSICANNLPEGLIARPSDIVWYRIVFGYAPELAVPFEYFMRTSAAEAAGKWDRIFATSLFWVTTKAVKCPYCMGHCEMNFEVAGLTQEEIARRSQVLSSSDWSAFSAAEQRAFAFAGNLSAFPHLISRADIDPLREAFGDEAALIVILNACRYHYMTRISNGFQLTLERENVFFDYYNVRGGK